MPLSECTTGLAGVDNQQYWLVQIMVNGSLRNLPGEFASKEEAESAALQFISIYNFPYYAFYVIPPDGRRYLYRLDIATVIRNELKVWNVSPESINNGLCDLFAEKIANFVPGAVAVWNWQESMRADPGLSKKQQYYLHCFVRYRDRYYDSESPDGVDDWNMLPFFVRWRSECGSVGLD